MIAALNRLVEFVEEHLADEIDLADLASDLGTTEYHVRRMVSSLAGMPLSEYIRRRAVSGEVDDDHVLIPPALEAERANLVGHWDEAVDEVGLPTAKGGYMAGPRLQFERGGIQR